MFALRPLQFLAVVVSAGLFLFLISLIELPENSLPSKTKFFPDRLWEERPANWTRPKLRIGGHPNVGGGLNGNKDHNIKPGKPPPSQLPPPSTTTEGKAVKKHHQSRRVAIVGAGASGASAAFWLERAARAAGLAEGQMEIVVFERNDYIGGRTTTVHPYDDPSLPPIELGASSFRETDRNLMHAVAHLNLTLDPATSSCSSGSSWGIYDGRSLLFSTTSSCSPSLSRINSTGWWDRARMWWRYGQKSPSKAHAAVQTVTDRLEQAYTAAWASKHGAQPDVEAWNEAVFGRSNLTAMSAWEYLVDEVGVGHRWVDEIVESISRVNYAQDPPAIHALAGSLALAVASSTPISVQGGNHKIFAGLLASSGATVELSTEVESIYPVLDLATLGTSWRVLTNKTDRALPLGEKEAFDAVVFAAPWYSSKVSKDEDPEGLIGLMDSIPSQPYVHLHVTLLITTSPRPSATFLNLEKDTVVPLTLLSTGATARAHVAMTSSFHSHPAPEFQSITYLDGGREIKAGSGEYLVKVVSLERRSDAWLEGMLGGKLSWVMRKEWHAYPDLPPRTSSFPPIQPLGRATPFYYLAAFEPWAATMETQTLAARNAVGLLAEDWWGLKMGGAGAGEGEGGGCEGEVGGWDWTCM